MSYFLVQRGPGPSWDSSRPLTEQKGWAEHAGFMNALAEEGFIRLGGPIGDRSESMHIVDSDGIPAIRDRLAADPWSSMGILRIVRIDPWEILLGEPPSSWSTRSSTEPSSVLPTAPSSTSRAARREIPSLDPGSAELFIFARFHAREGQADPVAAALREVRELTREEPGCRAHEVFRSIRDPRLFWVHSRWVDEAAFERHAELPHTTRFVARVEPLLDHGLEVSRSRVLP